MTMHYLDFTDSEHERAFKDCFSLTKTSAVQMGYGLRVRPVDATEFANCAKEQGLSDCAAANRMIRRFDREKEFYLMFMH